MNRYENNASSLKKKKELAITGYETKPDRILQWWGGGAGLSIASKVTHQNTEQGF